MSEKKATGKLAHAKGAQKSAKSTTFTVEEQAAIKERAQELRAEARANKDKTDGERAVLATFGGHTRVLTEVVGAWTDEAGRVPLLRWRFGDFEGRIRWGIPSQIP